MNKTKTRESKLTHTQLKAEENFGELQPPKKWWTSSHEKAEELSRWLSLYEAINYIGDKAEEKGLDFETLDLKPLAIHRYMKSVENIFLKKILQEEVKNFSTLDF
jgi:hypothetical protein